MSSATTGAPDLVAPGDHRGSRQPRPGVAVAVQVEVAKLISQLPLRIVLAVSMVVRAAFAVVMRAGSTRPTDTLFGRWAGTAGFATSLTVLSWATAWGGPLLAGLFAGDIFASEDRNGTWKTILTRSCTRTRLFLGKAVAATLCVWFSFAAIAAVSVVAGLADVGSAPLVGLSGQLIGSGSALGLVAAGWGLSLLRTSTPSMPSTDVSAPSDRPGGTAGPVKPSVRACRSIARGTADSWFGVVGALVAGPAVA
jgi:ABC-2 type transport system permease protein